ncbi:RecBCD enzyme subunit RecB [Serratia symbiotica]|nr:RecBCD enzyme subunit RecB [Serratia symbiotica]
MKEKFFKKFDPLTIPLFGTQLIEASAGTGKTFTIGILYLRLLLGLGKKSAFSRPLKVKEILVVTFTDTASEELRIRIQNNINDLYMTCIYGKSKKPLFLKLLNEINNLSNAIKILYLAKTQIHKMEIYTIHSLCQNILNNNILKSRILFKQTLIKDEILLRQQACTDFWRRYFYPLPLDLARIIYKEWNSPKDLLYDLSDFLNISVPIIHPKQKNEETILIRHKKNIEYINSIKIHWKKVENDIKNIILQSDINKHIYNKKNVSNWLQKINEWTIKETLDYTLPKELKKFKQSILIEKTKKNNIPYHIIFHDIDKLFSISLTLRDLIIKHALNEIHYFIKKEKKIRSEIFFNDLINKTKYILYNVEGEKLAKNIRYQYPIAIIDEFQDTDSEQYSIFKKIYIGHKKCGLLLIGDPKQAIYSFRGTDIFTYIRARNEINSHYTLETNWRSSPAMVTSINKLFSQIKKPFLFDQIPFIKINSAKKNHKLLFKINNKIQPAIKFWLQRGENVNITDYQKYMSKLCALQICNILNLGQKKQALLYNSKDIKPVQASNITVLVRTHYEAIQIYNELNSLYVPTIYLSNQNNVFNTSEAKDLLFLLCAILTPENQLILQRGIATNLMGLDILTLFNLKNNKNSWNLLINEFYKYNEIWKNYGIISMLYTIIKTYNIEKNILSLNNGKQYLTNILHLSQLLQETSIYLKNKDELIYWFEKQIQKPDFQSEKQKIKIENNENLVKIITIHKSKGLEFDIVWLPFISNFYQKKIILHHDRNTFEKILNFNFDKKKFKLSEEERLSEDLRLLYVALTRSIYHTSIGISHIIYKNNKNIINVNLHQSAQNYLIQSGKLYNVNYFYDCLKKIVDNNITISEDIILNQKEIQFKNNTSKEVLTKNFTRYIKNFWNVISYTSFLKNTKNSIKKIVFELNANDFNIHIKNKEIPLTQHTFPRGLISGKFLHKIFEKLNFTQPLNQKKILEQLRNQDFSDKWQPILLKWINILLNTPLNNYNLTLSKITSQNKQCEFQFQLSINKLLKAKDFNNLIKFYDPISARCPDLSFKDVKGILQGFIDLVFYWKGKYYLLDYKSNWLGEDSNNYTQSKIENEIIEHRYDLQYQIYTLALHRYLKYRIKNYKYQYNFGGVIYLFLRGIDIKHPKNGIFNHYPNKKLIENMDYLFSGNY